MTRRYGDVAPAGAVRVEEVALRKGPQRCEREGNGGCQVELRGAAAQLSPAAAEAYKAQWAAGTRRLYEWHWEHWREWLERRALTPELAGEVELSDYLSEGSLAPETIRSRYVGVRMGYRQRGMEAPSGLVVSRVFSGLVKIRAREVRRALPLTADMIRMLVVGIATGRLANRDRCLLALGFGGALRESELVGLNWSDVEMNSTGLRVRLRRSKAAAGPVNVNVMAGRDGTACPQHLFVAWRLDAEDQGRPVRPTDAVFGLSTGGVTHVVRKLVRALLPEEDAKRYSSHSLRAGFATSAYMAGEPLVAIRDHMRHKSLRVLEVYIREIKRLMEHPGRGLL